MVQNIVTTFEHVHVVRVAASAFPPIVNEISRAENGGVGLSTLFDGIPYFGPAIFLVPCPCPNVHANLLIRLHDRGRAVAVAG